MYFPSPSAPPVLFFLLPGLSLSPPSSSSSSTAASSSSSSFLSLLVLHPQPASSPPPSSSAFPAHVSPSSSADSVVGSNRRSDSSSDSKANLFIVSSNTFGRPLFPSTASSPKGSFTTFVCTCKYCLPTCESRCIVLWLAANSRRQR